MADNYPVVFATNCSREFERLARSIERFDPKVLFHCYKHGKYFRVNPCFHLSFNQSMAKFLEGGSLEILAIRLQSILERLSPEDTESLSGQPSESPARVASAIMLCICATANW